MKVETFKLVTQGAAASSASVGGAAGGGLVSPVVAAALLLGIIFAFAGVMAKYLLGRFEATAQRAHRAEALSTTLRTEVERLTITVRQMEERERNRLENPR